MDNINYLKKKLKEFKEVEKEFNCDWSRKTKDTSLAMIHDHFGGLLHVNGNIICIDCWLKLDAERKQKVIQNS